MSTPVIQTAFVTGEVGPSLFGHVDLARLHSAASTMRNMFVGFRGGAYSRAGTAYVGFSKQTGRNYPPRLIPFQFNINQGLVLEFGNLYMRVISEGAYVTEPASLITNISQANPAVVTSPAVGAATATPNVGAVVATYAPGDTVTLAGGVFTRAAVLSVVSTKLLSTVGQTVGHGYVPGDTVTLAGGVQTTAPIVTVATTGVSAATINAAGTGGTDGTQIVTGTTGTGTKFQASVTVSGGAITAVIAITLAGSYTVNPTVLTAEPVTGAGLVGATLNIKMGVVSANVTTAGLLTGNPAGNVFTQASTSGSGSAEVFIFGLLAPVTMSISDPGVYATFPTNPVAQDSSSGTGLGATFNLTSTAVSAFNTGDWVFLAGIGGMTELNGEIVVVQAVTTSTFSLFDVYGNPIDSTAFGTYTSGGTIQRLYTLTTIYGEADLPYLKFTQSADVMSICCVNQATGTEYPPQDLRRTTDTDWAFAAVIGQSMVGPPSGALTGVATATGTVNYAYVVTAVDTNGIESVASAAITLDKKVDIAATAGSITLSWPAVEGATQYNVYKATPSHGTPIAAGAAYGFSGSAFGTRFVDNNIVADFSQTPPLHRNPFARGQIIEGQVVSGGSGFTAATATLNTLTGSGGSLSVVVNTGLTPSGGSNTVTPGPVSATIVNDPGENYAATDSFTIGGDGSGATGILKVGPQSGTYPAVVNYFQERRVYAYTLNNPDTYFMSQPGSFTNFDTRIPATAGDAITGTPWAVEVNGIQFMVSMPGGLVVLTGLSAWQLTGTGGSSLNPQPITPSTQQAQPQAYNGCAATVPPIKIDYDVIYVQAKGSIYRDLAYNFFTNIYTGSDLTQNSPHLFSGYTIREHAWCEEPYKVLWSVRDDGVLLSLTYNKPQEVTGWGRHDTFGSFETVCSVTEPPVDALYVGVKRFIGANTAYVIERMNDRIWNSIDDVWCVDCGTTLSQPTPNATLTASSATGAGAVTGATSLVGGSGYSTATTAVVVDGNGEGPGTGAAAVLTIVGGVITGVAFPPGSQGSGYVSPQLVITDPANTGSGASCHLTLSNAATFTASAAVFAPGSVGSVIRMGGGTATVTAYLNPTQVTADISSPIIQTIPNSDFGSGPLPMPQTAGNWTLTAPVTVLGGLNYLAGATVTGVYDGKVLPPTIVPANGKIVLPAPATSAVLGLGFQAQLQSVYLEVGTPTVQGQRKKISAVTARLELSRGVKIGSNQVDGSTLSPPQLAPKWINLTDVPDKAMVPYNSMITPLYTGDVRIPVSGGYQTPGQVAVQQDNPLPLNVLAFIPELLPGDISELQAPQRQRERERQR